MSKTYSTKAAAKLAIRKKGLQNVSHLIVEALGGQWKPTFRPETIEDVKYIEELGFEAKLALKKF